jgi:ribosomal protein L37AE/L43A
MICKQCGAKLSKTNKFGLCWRCNPKCKTYKSPGAGLPNKSYYKEMLEKEKGLPTLKKHLRNREQFPERYYLK